MRGLAILYLAAVLAGWGAPAAAAETPCEACHRSHTPGIVTDWEMSAHAANDVTCSVCHGDEHMSPEDTDRARLATWKTCEGCHAEQVEQFKAGKHSLAWTAANAMPTTHWQPMALLEGQKGCTGCHKIGLKSDEEIQDLRDKGVKYGSASCDSCHTRHLFSTEEASEPEACRTCHMGIDHPQWEMYESSKHGVRYLLSQKGVLADTVSAPKCQTCHLPDGTHENDTAWGFLAVRLPMPEDEQWAEDRATILQGLGVLGPDGKPTDRLEVVKQARVAKLTEEAWQKERTEMIDICSGCHSEGMVKTELRKGDAMIREADHLMAEAIRVVASLYDEGLLEKPDHYAYAYPDLLAFHDAPTVVENKLFLMFLKHRMRTFQGAFHMNPDYTFWYGWSEMVRDLQEIRRLAAEMRDKAG
jgi:hypothetical protein